MKYLGIDYGNVRLGLAVSDEMGMIATPLSVVGSGTQEDNVARVAEEVLKHDAGMVVVGMPVQLDGDRGIAANKVQGFVDLLAGKLDIPVEVWDERLTTAQAEKSMIASDISRQKRKKLLDAVAAQIMLQSFIDSRATRNR